MITPLFGFSEYVVQSLEQIKLSISLGEEPRQQNLLTTFTMVEAPSSYNIILGRLVLIAFQVVASLYHQKK